MSNLEKLQNCFREALALPSDAVVEGLAYKKHPSWDSVAQMRLLAAIEGSFDLLLDINDILHMNSFDKAKEILSKQGVSFDG